MTLFSMEDRANSLRSMQICRICLDESGPLISIYSCISKTKEDKYGIPMQLQIMACLSLETHENDGMPKFICSTCKAHTIQAYNFKTLARKSDEALKLYLSTGKLKKPCKPWTEDNAAIEKHPVAENNSVKSTVEDNTTLQHQEEAAEASEDMDYVSSLNYASNMSTQSSETLPGPYELPDQDMNMMKVNQVQTSLFPCPHCERTFPLKQLLDLHVCNHTRERNFPCEVCKRRFFTKYDLAKHLQRHTLSKSYVCTVCNKSFSAEALLHRHQKTHIDFPKYMCPDNLCEKTFVSRADLDLHVEKHKKKRPFSCRVCDKKFVFKQGLQRHEASHADDKPHKCNYCEASFTSPIKLMRHITSHAGLRPYPCKLCGRTFLLSHHLTRHMRGHYANKSEDLPIGQYKCDVCSMSFRRKDSLINHSAIHSMVNLKCVICNTEFSKAKDVKEHITTHLAGLPYPCDKCDYSFETQDQLEEHELKHAAMEYEEQIEQEITQEQATQYQSEQYEEDDGEDDDNEMAEYTITTDADDNPQIVPSSRKIKNYAQFLKDELGSDVEDEIVEESETSLLNAMQDDSTQEEPAEPIKPIVRSEGTKVYTRRSTNKKLPVLKDAKSTDEGRESDISLESLGLTQELVKDLPNEQYIDMKIGDVIYKVKKVTMKKTEFDAVAKQDNVEMKGGILVKKTLKGPEVVTTGKGITIENIIDEPKPSISMRQLVKKTYVKKTPSNSSVNTNTSDKFIVEPETSVTSYKIQTEHIMLTE